VNISKNKKYEVYANFQCFWKCVEKGVWVFKILWSPRYLNNVCYYFILNTTTGHQDTPEMNIVYIKHVLHVTTHRLTTFLLRSHRLPCMCRHNCSPVVANAIPITITVINVLACTFVHDTIWSSCHDSASINTHRCPFPYMHHYICSCRKMQTGRLWMPPLNIITMVNHTTDNHE
jgi:hypothetical protein